MAFDPLQEDCLRLVLEGMRRDAIFPLENAAYIDAGIEAYHRDPAELIKTDRDRSFHLTARAAEILDYKTPFLNDEAEVEKQEDIAEGLLREAVSLDARNWDAQRMLEGLTGASPLAYVTYLMDNLPKVEDDLASLDPQSDNPYDREMALGMGRHPYLRWRGALATHALITGQYSLALDAAKSCLELAPHDPGDMRHTAVLAMAKLEYPTQAIESFCRQWEAGQLRSPGIQREERRPGLSSISDPWELLALLACAYRSYDFDGAGRILRRIVSLGPHAAETLFYQAELPEGLYARVNVQPGSDDELVIAVSEATPLLQEGAGTAEAAGFALWIANHDVVQSALKSADRAYDGRINDGPRGNN